MVLFTFLYNKKINKNETVQVPAVYFTNNSYSISQVRELVPGLTYQTTYPIDLANLDVPLNTLLYADDKVLDLLSINSELELQNREMILKIEELNNKVSNLEKNVGGSKEIPISDIGRPELDEPTHIKNRTYEYIEDERDENFSKQEEKL
jgi:hypothetical protein